MQLNLLSKYDNLTFKHSPTLFDLPILKSMKKTSCAFCGKSLKLVRDRIWMCDRKKCPCYLNTKKKYIITRETMDKVKIR